MSCVLCVHDMFVHKQGIYVRIEHESCAFGHCCIILYIYMMYIINMKGV